MAIDPIIQPHEHVTEGALIRLAQAKGLAASKLSNARDAELSAKIAHDQAGEATTEAAAYFTRLEANHREATHRFHQQGKVARARAAGGIDAPATGGFVSKHPVHLVGEQPSESTLPKSRYFIHDNASTADPVEVFRKDGQPGMFHADGRQLTFSEACNVREKKLIVDPLSQTQGGPEPVAAAVATMTETPGSARPTGYPLNVTFNGKQASPADEAGDNGGDLAEQEREEARQREADETFAAHEEKPGDVKLHEHEFQSLRTAMKHEPNDDHDAHRFDGEGGAMRAVGDQPDPSAKAPLNSPGVGSLDGEHIDP